MRYYAIIEYPESRPGHAWSDHKDREYSRDLTIYRNRKEAEHACGPEDRIVAIEVPTKPTWRKGRA